MAGLFTREDFVMQYGGRCRDCADHNGFCPASGLPCKPEEARRAVRWVLNAIRYGETHGYIADLTGDLAAPPASSKGEALPVAWTTGTESWFPTEHVSECVTKLTRHAQPEYGFTQPLYARPSPGVSREEVATLPREQSLLDALTTIRDDYRINHTSKFAHGIAAGALEVHGTWFATSSQREGE